MKVRQIIYLLPLLSLMSGCKPDTIAKEDHFITQTIPIGNLEVEVLDVGQGTHTFVFLHGLGGELDEWVRSNIVEEISNNNQVIAYNRAGYGESSITSAARTFDQMALELNQLISELSQNEKVILVGHAWGATLIRVYATQFPEKVLGSLMIDPRHEDMYELEELDVTNWLNETEGSGPKAEIASFIENIEYLADLQNLPDFPTTILTAYGPIVNLDIRFEAHRSLGRGISPGAFTHYTVDQIGHQIHLETPTLIIAELFSLKEKTR